VVRNPGFDLTVAVTRGSLSSSCSKRATDQRIIAFIPRRCRQLLETVIVRMLRRTPAARAHYLPFQKRACLCWLWLWLCLYLHLHILIMNRINMTMRATRRQQRLRSFRRRARSRGDRVVCSTPHGEMCIGRLYAHSISVSNVDSWRFASVLRVNGCVIFSMNAPIGSHSKSGTPHANTMPQRLLHSL
jgi:hypothetical protein